MPVVGEVAQVPHARISTQSRARAPAPRRLPAAPLRPSRGKIVMTSIVTRQPASRSAIQLDQPLGRIDHDALRREIHPPANRPRRAAPALPRRAVHDQQRRPDAELHARRPCRPLARQRSPRRIRPGRARRYAPGSERMQRVGRDPQLQPAQRLGLVHRRHAVELTIQRP